ncbi:hypothetical protein FXW78_22655 [Rhodococcus opacus]|nr:hypothetical protein [Rhodococcus opacus]
MARRPASGRRPLVDGAHYPSGAPVDGPMLAMAPDGRRMVRADASRETLWALDLDEGSAVSLQRQSAEHRSPLVVAEISRDGSRIAFALEDRSIVVFDADSGGVVRVVATGFEGAISSLTISADARLIAAGSEDKSVRVWDVVSGRTLGVPLTGPAGTVSHLAFGPDGRRLAAGEGKSVWIWDVESARPIGGPLQGHDWDITSVVFGADGHRVISYSGDSVAVWDADTARQVAQASRGAVVRPIRDQPEREVLRRRGGARSAAIRRADRRADR